MNISDSKPTVSVHTAQSVLWHFGDENLGLQPGGFWTTMFKAWEHADAQNRERALVGWPEEATAFFAVKSELWGLDWLRKKVKDALVPDRELRQPDLIDAAAEQVQS